MTPLKTGLLALAFSFTPITEMAMEEDAPPVSAPTLSLVMEGVVDIGIPRQMGESPNGVRREIPITGGTFSGPEFAATVLPGGSDWQLQRADGGLEIVADYTLQTEDGVFIRVINEGVSYPASDDRARYTPCIAADPFVRVREIMRLRIKAVGERFDYVLHCCLAECESTLVGPDQRHCDACCT